MALAGFGSDTGSCCLVEELATVRKQAQRSQIDAHGRPIGGMIEWTDPYWCENQLITLLGHIRERRALKLLCDIVRETDSGGPPRSHARLHWRRVPSYDRIVCLCYALERFADRSAIEPLEALMKRPHLSGYVVKDINSPTDNYASAYLELLMARTLERCGGRRGLSVLADYVDDVRAVLSQHAYKELVSITGHDFGPDALSWKEWICRQPRP